MDDWHWIMRSLRIVPPKPRNKMWSVEMAVYAGDRPTYRYGPRAVSGPFGHEWLYRAFRELWARPIRRTDCESRVYFGTEQEARECFEFFQKGRVIS